MAGPLTGITVVDISAVISGPWCCQILADQGATVVKVEPHGVGDLTRIGGFRVGTISAMYAAANRGKRYCGNIREALLPWTTWSTSPR